MANDAQHRAEPAFKAENEADLLLGRANPNPDRVGCPRREALIALARRQVPVGDPIGEHVASCSPCYREMRAIQQAEGIRPAEEGPRSRAWWPAAAAAVLLIVGGAVAWWLHASRPETAAPVAPQVAAVAQPVEVTLDLRRYGVTRSDGPANDLPPLVLPRAKVKLTLLLPVESEPGEYEVALAGADGTVLTSADGRTEVRQFVTTVAAYLDLRGFAGSSVRVGVRAENESWRFYEGELR